MKTIPSGSIDLIYTDLPYGSTQNGWDKKIPLDLLWKEWNRVLKETGAVILWSQMPYTAEIIMSNQKDFRYEWIIEKTNCTGFLNANRMPLKCHENVLVFYRKLPVYNPQKTSGHKPVHSWTKHKGDGTNYGSTIQTTGGGSTERFPRDVLKFSWDTQRESLHPTQKPVSAAEYFIRTYTNDGDTVLDCCMGSGTAGVACLNTGRTFIGIEKNAEIFEKAKQRIETAQKKYLENNREMKLCL